MVRSASQKRTQMQIASKTNMQAPLPTNYYLSLQAWLTPSLSRVRLATLRSLDNGRKLLRLSKISKLDL